MKVSTLMLVLFLFSFSYNFAQVVGGSDAKLASLYNEGKFEKCLFKADNLTYKEGSSRDPEPYLYVAMCFYELSKSSDVTLQEDYKDGVKQAIKYTAKFIRKDKKGEMYSDNIEFINELKEIQYKKVKDYFNDDNYKKAGSNAKTYNRLNKDEDFLVLYFVGICEILSNNYSQGSRDIEEARAELDEILKTGSVKTDKIFKPLFPSVILKYSEYLVKEKNKKAAINNLELGLKILPDDSFLKVQYNMINETTKAKSDSTVVD